VRPDAEGLDVVALDEELVDEAKRRRRGQQLGQYLYIYITASSSGSTW
jgi:hypothetical protein